MKKELFKFVLVVLAFYLITYYSNWQASLGVFFALWANNLDYVREE